MDSRKDKEPVVGRLDDVDEAVEPLLGLRTDASRRLTIGAEGTGLGPGEPQTPIEPGEEPALSLAEGLTSRSRSGIRPEMSGTPGALLRDARERADLDVSALAQRTRLSRKVIEDMEANRFEAVPPAYLRGYLRAAAKELGADGDHWIRAYESLGYADPVVKPDAMSRAPGVRSPRTHSGPWYGLLAVLLVGLLALGIYAWEGRGNPVTSVGTWLEERGGFGWLERWTERNSRDRPAREMDESVQDGPLDMGSVLFPAVVEIEPPLPGEPGLESAEGTEPGLAGSVPAAPEASVQHEGWGPVDPARAEDARVGTGAGERAFDEVPDGADPADTGAAVLVHADDAGSGEAGLADAQAVVSSLRLAFQDTSWVEVRSASEQVELLGVFHAGDDRTVNVRLPARVVLGNARAVALSMDGTPVDLTPYTRRDRTARFTLGAD